MRSASEIVSRETLPVVIAAMEQLRLQLEAWGIGLDDSLLPHLEQYAHLLAEYNLANVIGTADQSQIITDHLVDSLSCLSFKDFDNAGSLVDVGTGGGLPGVPLGIARPGLSVTLLEATEKKVKFLRYVQEELGMWNMQLLNSRAEEVGKAPKYREAFQVATARAVAALPVITEYCAPLVQVGGTILALKGRLPDEELAQGVKAGSVLGLEFQKVLRLEYLKELRQKERRIVVFKKVAAISKSFPRRTGLAKKRPLGV